jgi:hypothetical protein
MLYLLFFTYLVYCGEIGFWYGGQDQIAELLEWMKQFFGLHGNKILTESIVFLLFYTSKLYVSTMLL